MARARDNENRLLAQRHQSHLERQQTQLEAERRVQNDRTLKS